ncbi:hypothetical protein EAI_11427, partial [Harpegnathos saltator]
PVIIAGDFNAHSEGWSCSPQQRDRRVDTLIGWAAGLGLILMNEGSESTCVRPGGNGASVIDLTWATPLAAGLFHEWKVEAEGETLSDHRHIVWTLHLPKPQQ